MNVLVTRNIKEILKNKKKNILIFVVPIMLVLVFMTIYSGTTINKKFMSTVQVGVIDKDGSIFSTMLIQHYKKNVTFSDFMNINIGDEQIIKENFDKGALDVIIVIPEKFAEKMIHMIHEPIDVKIKTKDPIKSIVISNLIKSYEKYISAVETNVSTIYQVMEKNNFTSMEISAINAKISYDLIMTALERTDFFEYNEIVEIPNTTAFNYFFIAITVLMIMYFGLYVGLDYIKEKEQLTMQRLFVIGYSEKSFVISKLISSVSFLFVNIIPWFILINFYIENTLSIKIFGFLLIITMFSVSISLFIASIFKSYEKFLMVGNIFYFITAVIGGSIIPLQFMPEKIQKFSMLTPNYWFIKGLLIIQKGIFQNTLLMLSFTTLILISCMIYITTYLVNR